MQWQTYTAPSQHPQPFSKSLSFISDPETPRVQRTNSGTEDGWWEQEGLGWGPTEAAERWTDRLADGPEQGRHTVWHGLPQQHPPHVRRRGIRSAVTEIDLPSFSSAQQDLTEIFYRLPLISRSATTAKQAANTIFWMPCLMLLFCFLLWLFFYPHSFLFLLLLVLPATPTILSRFLFVQNTSTVHNCSLYTSICLYSQWYHFLPVIRFLFSLSLVFNGTKSDSTGTWW